MSDLSIEGLTGSNVLEREKRDRGGAEEGGRVRERERERGREREKERERERGRGREGWRERRR